MLSQKIFPFISETFAESYFIPVRDISEKGPQRTLPALFQRIWNDIREKEKSNLPMVPNWVGIDLLTLAKQYVQKEKAPPLMLCKGVLTEGYELENLHYQIQVIPGTEPTVELCLSRHEIEIKLSCTQWDMGYRPNPDWKYKPCWFALSSERYKTIGTERKSVEWLQLWNANFSYRGEMFFGKTLEERFCVCEVDYDVYTAGRNSGKTVLKTSGPFIKKMNEHLGMFGIMLPWEPLRNS
jgi:hypothetical protein